MTFTPETIEFEKDGTKFRILIKHDEMPCNPRKDFDPPSVMLSWGRYGYTDPEKNPYSDPSYFEDDWTGEDASDEFKDALRLAVCFHSHGGTNYWVGRPNDMWDSGQCGWIYCTRETIEHEWGTEPDAEGVTPDERAIAYMTNEVKTFSDWASGNTWGFTVEKFIPACDHGHSEEWVEDDSYTSVWGFIGDDRGYGGCIAEACGEAGIPVPDQFKEREATAA